jgi:hypothetical protein
MSSPAELSVRLGERGDADAIGRLLHDFNVEFDEPNREGSPDGPVNYFYEREL